MPPYGRFLPVEHDDAKSLEATKADLLIRMKCIVAPDNN
jgi:hypothetical protein